MITITLSTKKQFAVYVLSLICLFFQQSTHAQHSTGYKLEHDGVIAWDFSRYLPDVVTICLGQNDGIQDSALFVGDYVDFLNRLRRYYPNSTFICLASPMADDALKNYMQKMLRAVVNVQHRQSDKKVYSYAFLKQYHNGCDYHPDLAEHKLIAGELGNFIKRIMKW